MLSRKIINIYNDIARKYGNVTVKKDPTTKIKTKILKQLKVLKDNKFIDNKLYYYLKPTGSPAPRFYGQPKLHKPRVPIRPILS